MLHGNPEACAKALAKAGLSWDDIAAVEVNEAFASVAIQFMRDTGLTERWADVNPNGGGISLGHPLGATGARVTATLLNELDRRDAQLWRRLHVHRVRHGDRRRDRARLAWPREIERVGVVGLGTMGAGIAQIALLAGNEVVGREVSEELNERARGRIEHFLGRAVEKGKLEAAERDAALGRLSTTTEVDELAQCDLVIEAIVEELDAKRALFAELERVCSPDAILATNTSALSVTEIAESTQRPERVIGMHFFNPAPLLPLVEIVRTGLSDESAVDAAYAWAERAGKQPVRCNDTPGFIVNRILIPLLNDCVRVLDEAGVSPEDLDKAMTNGAGWPMGPCALIDLIGIDIHIHASEALHGKLGEPRMGPPERLVAMQADGRLGRKSGEGFYRYE